MDNTVIRNIVLFKPSGADFCHNFAYKDLDVEHLDEEKFLTFEFKGNRIASFDADQNPCFSVETEPVTGTTTLSLRDNKPVVVIQGRNNFANFAFFRTVIPYATVPITSGYAEGLKIRFQPATISKSTKRILHRYTILDEQRGNHLGVLLLPAGGAEMTLAFEEGVTDTQKKIIIGTSGFIIADTFRVKYLADASMIGFICAIFIIFLVALYFQ